MDAELLETATSLPKGIRSTGAGLRTVRRALVFVAGVTVVLLGVAMIVLPGPAFVVIPAGIGILALEFFWARRLLVRMRRSARSVTKRAQRARRAHSEARLERRSPVRAALRAAMVDDTRMPLMPPTSELG